MDVLKKRGCGKIASGCGRAAVVMLVLLCAAGRARAAVAVLLEQPYGKLNVIAPAGHSAIYLNHVCAQTPLVLRPCRAGETGVVLSRYDGVGDHDWIAIPLIPYLYAVPSSEEIPDRIDHAGEQRTRDAYRREYLEAVAPDTVDGSAPDNNWYELVGSAFDRTLYGFQVDTTPEQDAHLIAVFNDQKNTEKYNGMFSNCADFARVTVNMFYPHAVRRNYIADFGLTSPKSVARGLAHYAAKHPETHFQMFTIPQLKGDLPRSHENVTLAEGVLKRLGVPLVVLSPVMTGVVMAAYLGHGRFPMPKDPPVLTIADSQPNADIWRPFQTQRPVLPEPVALEAVSLRDTSAAGLVSVAHAPAAGRAGMTRVGLIAGLK